MKQVDERTLIGRVVEFLVLLGVLGGLAALAVWAIVAFSPPPGAGNSGDPNQITTCVPGPGASLCTYEDGHKEFK